MHCPFCGHEDTQVKDSRPSEEGVSIRRRRMCSSCHARFTTFERIILRELTVVKKDGRRRPFDREKLARSIGIAVRKRPISEEQVQQIVHKIAHDLERSGDNEITSGNIGHAVMDALSELDPVAYVRFASVYKEFRKAKDFEDFIGTIMAKTK